MHRSRAPVSRSSAPGIADGERNGAPSGLTQSDGVAYCIPVANGELPVFRARSAAATVFFGQLQRHQRPFAQRVSSVSAVSPIDSKYWENYTHITGVSPVTVRVAQAGDAKPSTSSNIGGDGGDTLENLKIAPITVRHNPLAEGENRNLVVINASPSELNLFRAACDSDRWRLHAVNTYREAMMELCHDRAPVIVCNAKLPDGTWEDILSGACYQTPRPRLIVLSKEPDEQLWSEVLNMGGFDLISSGMSTDDVRRLLDSAWRNWCDEARQEGWRRARAKAAG
jgi:hypothetical protein